MKKFIICSIFLLSIVFQQVRCEQLAKLGVALVEKKENKLIVSTGLIQRTWLWTGKGLVTVSLKDLRSNKEWITRQSSRNCDWDLPNTTNIEEGTEGELIGIVASIKEDEGFSNKYIEIVSTIRYNMQRIEIQHVVWIYPNAGGVRTQLRVKALAGFDFARLPASDETYVDCGATFLKPGARSEYLPLAFDVPNERLYWGFYNNPGNRHDQSQDMLKEQEVKGWPVFLREDIDWASAVAIKYGNEGVIVVKESPKCVNQPAHNTGSFSIKPWGLSVTGWGVAPSEILNDRFRECWANWVILYRDGNDGIQKAVKQFDAIRYPVFPARDMFILSNTWGPANPGGAQFTEEEFLMKEIPCLSKVGIDVMQIDDGWQKMNNGGGAKDFLPKYKNGWDDIKKECTKYSLKLGLWIAIQNADTSDLKYDLDQLGFISWKADFDHLATMNDYENRIKTYRSVMKHSWMNTQFSLCPEYDDPRYGWYFAKEYGSIYFQNIQEAFPEHLTMVPFQVLRQHWLMSKYFTANKLQVMLQNPKRVGKYSDGKEYSHSYSFAMGLPFVPCFFQSAQNLDETEIAELHSLIMVYKSVREDVFTSTTYPIGQLPDNASWTGFQMVSTKRDGGFLLLFRELHNGKISKNVDLKFLAGKTLRITNLETKRLQIVKVSTAGSATFTIQQPADYLFLKYEVIH